jgi:hypothetical protein
MESLSGGPLIQEGLADLRRGEITIRGLLVLVGVPEVGIRNPEHRLYELLALANPDAAHSRYNALIRRLVRFEHAAECAGP